MPENIIGLEGSCMKIEMKWKKEVKQIAEEATGKGSTLLFMANEARRLMEPYVPARNMILSRNVRTYVQGNEGIYHNLAGGPSRLYFLHISPKDFQLSLTPLRFH